MSDKITIRDATRRDLDIIAGIFTRARQTLSVPALHSEEQDKEFVRDTLFPACRIRLAFFEKRACGFSAIEDGWIRQIHVDPGHFGLGVGSALIRDAKAREPRLELWCFEDNARARNLYERHGFKPAEFTDGSGNEENTPDVRYVWERHEH